MEPPKERRANVQLNSQAVPEAWVENFSDTEEARRMAQLEADVDLVTRLMFGGFTGQDWDRCAERLVGYGLMVITAWVITGRIIDRCHHKGYGPLERSSSIRNQDAADELAGETVALALVKFRDTVLARGKWDPNRGASLRTFFIGQCLIRFPNIYRRWLTEQRARTKDRDALSVVALEDLRQGSNGERDLDEMGELAHAGFEGRPSVRFGFPVPDDNPARHAVNRVEARRWLDRVEADDQAIVTLTADGLEQEDISVLLGRSETAVRSKLFRIRKRLTKTREEEDDAAS